MGERSWENHRRKGTGSRDILGGKPIPLCDPELRGGDGKSTEVSFLLLADPFSPEMSLYGVSLNHAIKTPHERNIEVFEAALALPPGQRSAFL